MTSAHNSDDVRIFVKECSSLARAGFDTYLVSRGDSREENGVHVIGLGQAPVDRFGRMFGFSRSIYKKALELDCDIYHFHDPELLPFGIKLKRKGKKVIFDSHEDVPQQIMDKKWIPVCLRKLVSNLYTSYESYSVKRLDAVVAATPYIKSCFLNRSSLCIDICNYPELTDIKGSDNPLSSRESIVCYAGGITTDRGESRMIQAMKNIDAKLLIAGKKDNKDIKNRTYTNIEYLGELNRKGINDLYNSSVVGLILLSPIGNYINSLPVKMFEYMAAGLPFVCSDFPLWKDIVEDSMSGICVNPDDIDEVSNAISFFLKNRDKAEQYGCNGRKATLDKYNWGLEEQKLCNLYLSLHANEEVCFE